MHLIHLSTVKQPDGIIEVEIIIVDPENQRKKTYTYYLGSEFAYHKFYNLYKKGRKLHGYALAQLNKFKIKEEKENEI